MTWAFDLNESLWRATGERQKWARTNKWSLPLPAIHEKIFVAFFKLWLMDKLNMKVDQ